MVERKKVKILNTSTNPLPAYHSSGASGMDLYAFLGKPVSIMPLERIAIPTGIFIELPLGLEGQIRSRSGYTLNEGIIVANSPGTIDSDFRGEIKIILTNLSNNQAVINPGDRIAQLIICAYEKISWVENPSLTITERNANGLGSTGK